MSTASGDAGLQVRRTAEGPVDLDALRQSANEPLITDWMRARLDRRDPYLPINDRDFEPPHELLVKLAQRAGRATVLRELFELGAQRLLEEAWVANPAWTEEILALVRVLRPLGCRAQLDSIVLNLRFTPAQTDKLLDYEWLATAAAYPPGPLSYRWRQILSHANKRYAVIAYWALAESGELGLQFLPLLFAALRPQERPALIGQAVRQASANLSTSQQFRACLLENEASYRRCDGLYPLVYAACERLGLAGFSLPAAETPALGGASPRLAPFANSATVRPLPC